MFLSDVTPGTKRGYTPTAAAFLCPCNGVKHVHIYQQQGLPFRQQHGCHLLHFILMFQSFPPQQIEDVSTPCHLSLPSLDPGGGHERSAPSAGCLRRELDATPRGWYSHPAPGVQGHVQFGTWIHPVLLCPSREWGQSQPISDGANCASFATIAA